MITEKKCSRCGVVRDSICFSLDKNSSSGLSCWCKSCKSETRKARYLKNRDKELAANKIWSQNNKDRHEFLKNRWHEENKEYYLSQQKEYNTGRKDINSEYGKQWYIQNKDRKLMLGRIWYQNNKEYRNALERKWRKNNPDKVRHLARLYRMVNADRCRSHTAKYRASKLQATPLWLDDGHIQEVLDFYTAAKMFQVYTGVDYQVDHIVPLKGETVCGLHVPWNLQILPSFENQSKGNRYWPDMPD